MPVAVRIDWVKTRLLKGDELGSFKGHEVSPEHDLARLYGVTARQIVEGNGVVFDTAPINAWVLATGGKKLSNGQPVFTENSVILLPPGGPRNAAANAPPKKKSSTVVIVGAVVGVAALAALAARSS